MDPPGRFLKKDEAGLWHDIGDKKARRKTSQLFREDAKLVREQVGNTPDQHGDVTDASEDTEWSNQSEATTNTQQSEGRIPRNTRAGKPSPTQTRKKSLPTRKNSTTKKQIPKGLYKPKSQQAKLAAAVGRKKADADATHTGGSGANEMPPLRGCEPQPTEDDTDDRKLPALAMETEEE